MLEVLYATGLRVSELVNLKSSQVNMNQGVLRIVGKGDRERLIPLGEEAVRWLQKFMNGPRLEILLERQTDYLFPTRRGDRMTRQAFWHIIKRYAQKAGVAEGAVAAYAAARIRHAPAESWRGPARRADAAGPQRPVDDADLHARRPRAHEGTARAASSRAAEVLPAARLSDRGGSARLLNRCIRLRRRTAQGGAPAQAKAGMNKVCCVRWWSVLLACLGLRARGRAAARACRSDRPRSARRIAKKFPEVKAEDVRPSQMQGIYEVTMGADMAYVSADGTLPDRWRSVRGRHADQPDRSRARRRRAVKLLAQAR